MRNLRVDSKVNGRAIVIYIWRLLSSLTYSSHRLVVFTLQPCPHLKSQESAYFASWCLMKSVVDWNKIECSTDWNGVLNSKMTAYVIRSINSSSTSSTAPGTTCKCISFRKIQASLQVDILRFTEGDHQFLLRLPYCDESCCHAAFILSRRNN